MKFAITAMVGRFPDAEGTDELWENLLAVRESVRTLSLEEVLQNGEDEVEAKREDYVRRAIVLPRWDECDPGMFGLSIADASLLDPQQRLLLEYGWLALERAGANGADSRARTAVYASVSTPDYANMAGLARTGLERELNFEKDHAAPRMAHKLGLRGPAVSIQTGCSSSLVAVHLACQSLSVGDADTALVGAASLRVPQARGYRYVANGIASRDGRCRPFDREASGTVRGSGVVAIVLRRLDDAIRQGDPIEGIILGSAINNDGAVRAGYSAPSATGQAEVIARALARAGISPAAVGYVEAHGTATRLGDAIEVEALGAAVGGRREQCRIGSIKGNIGHLDVAAGLAGLTKAVRCLQACKIPPTAGFEAENPDLALAEKGLRVVAKVEDWARAAHDQFAGVSSFGMGGTNAHVIAGRWSEPAPSKPPTRQTTQALLLSAPTRPQLDALRVAVGKHAGQANVDLEGIATSLVHGRRAWSERLAIVTAEKRLAINALSDARPADGCDVLVGTASHSSPLILECPPLQAMVEYGADIPDLARAAGLLTNADGILGGELIANLNGSATSNAPLARWLFSCLAGMRLIGSGVRPDLFLGGGSGLLIALVLSGACTLEALLPVLSESLAHLPANADGDPAGYLSPSALRRIQESSMESAPIRCYLTGEAFGAGKSGIEAALRGSRRPFSVVDAFRDDARRATVLALGPRSLLTDPTFDAGQSASCLREGSLREAQSFHARALALAWTMGRDVLVDGPRHARRISLPTVEPKRKSMLATRSRPGAGHGSSSVTFQIRLLGWSPFAKPVAARPSRVAYLGKSPQGAAVMDQVAASGHDWVRLDAVGELDALADSTRGDQHLVAVFDGPTTEAELRHILLDLSALGRQTSLSKRHLNVVVLTSGSLPCNLDDDIEPLSAALDGFLLVLTQETPHISGQLIDMRRDAGPADERAAAELLGHATWGPAIAVRGGRAWSRSLGSGLAPPPNGGSIRNGATYLVTGGLGRIGRVLCTQLISRYDARVLVLARTYDESTSPQWATSADPRRLFVVRGDVAVQNDLRRVAESLPLGWGPIAGVVHAAGVTRGPSLQPCHALRGEHFDDQLRPKGAGTENIADVFRDAKLDFCLAFSSLAAVLGGSGFAAYAAANSYLNACVVRERRRGHPWLSVHWDAWRAPDGAAQRPVDHLDDESGWQAFERCVALCRSTSDAASVVVGCGDMDARWLRWREHAGLGKISSVDSVSESDLLDEQGIVARLVAIWVEALGEPTADSQTRLLDAGGHSMTALQISGDIERLYGVELMLDEILILGSPSAIAERIRAELLREARPTFRT